MKLSPLTSAALQVAIVLACGTAGAADPLGGTGGAATPVLPAVQVAAPRDPVEKSYRKIVRGMDLFEQRRGLAPDASLRFKLLPGNRREVLPVDKLYAGISHDRGMANDLGYCDCQVLLDRTYYAPLADRSWPDDTLIVLEYMDA